MSHAVMYDTFPVEYDKSKIVADIREYVAHHGDRYGRRTSGSRPRRFSITRRRPKSSSERMTGAIMMESQPSSMTSPMFPIPQRSKN